MRSHLSIGPQQQGNHRLSSPIYVMPRKRGKGRRAESIQLRGRLLSHTTVHNAVQERTARKRYVAITASRLRPGGGEKAGLPIMCR